MTIEEQALYREEIRKLRELAIELKLSNQLIQIRPASLEEWDKVKFDAHQQFVLNLGPPTSMMNPDRKTTWNGRKDFDFNLGRTPIVSADRALGEAIQ